MSSYRGRGQDVDISFLANLNTYPPVEESVDTFDPSELARYTNLQFYDFDVGSPTPDITISHSLKDVTKPEPNASVLDEADPMSLIDYGDFDYSQALSAIADIDQEPSSLSMMSLVSHGSTAVSPASDVSSPPSTNFNATPSAVRNYQTDAATGKRKAIAVDDAPQSLEEASRVAAEEDKRRRNTAASARFRIKKKLREQALERTAKEMTEKVGELQMRINQLEMENKWLKNLITEKNAAKSGLDLDISGIFNAKSLAAAAATAAATTNTSSAATSPKKAPLPSAPAQENPAPSPIKKGNK